jgi:hypothetical protein
MGQTAISCTDRRQASPADRIQLENIQCITLIRSVVWLGEHQVHMSKVQPRGEY